VYLSSYVFPLLRAIDSAMQPPIPLGTMLQKRYRVTKILGQGGFGRTYLAQDTACFDELCVLKEFTPNERGRDSLRKARELFKREAEALYAINHPQIPRFRANFEEAKRLFLIQEYAEGKTYAKILGERIRESRTFTEQEAITFLQNMLPVLENIHAQGIIHRDISPDNIICRESDKLPILIDFGVVKAGVKNLEAEGDVGEQGTTVGKAGYAPNEQLQTGEAYANSDLYALAVTTVVMMTGRKPESLIDKSSMSWKWQQWLPTISPWFAKVLMRMMSYRPAARYQSAKEVAQALRSVAELVAGGDNPELIAALDASPGSGTTGNSGQAPNRYTTYTPKRRQRSPILNSPWILAGAGGLLALVPFVLLKMMFSDGPSKPPSPSNPPIVSDKTPAPPVQPATAAPVAPSAPQVLASEQIVINPGQPFIRQSTLQTNQEMVYRLTGLQQNQTLAANVNGGVKMSIVAPNSQPVDFRSTEVVEWNGTILVAGEYIVKVRLPDGLPTAAYTLTINSVPPIAPVGGINPNPAATISPVATPTPLVVPNTIPPSSK
jgi:serine/threonine protein kinase